MRTAPVFLLVVLWSASCLSGAELKGYVSDAACGWNNAREGKEAKECALKCVKGGWDPVFVPDGETKELKFADKKAVMGFVGDHVLITGEVAKGVVVVRQIRLLSVKSHR